MDCRTFLDLLDSYWCGELLVETYHSMLSHANDCPACRCELAARAHLRARLRQAGRRTQMSACLRQRLRQVAERGHCAR